MIKTILSTLLLSTSVLAANDVLMTEVNPVQKANDFTLQSSSGGPVTLSDYSGKYVLVNFWAHWCTPCIKEFPDMQELYEKVNTDKFEIIAIHAGPYNSEAEEFVEHFGITFPVVSDPDTSLKGWDVPALPISYLIDPEGNISYIAIGPRSWDVKEMNVLLNK